MNLQTKQKENKSKNLTKKEIKTNIGSEEPFREVLGWTMNGGDASSVS